MAALDTQILARDAAKEVTVTVQVKGLNEMKFRLWVATQIVRLGIWVAGMNCKLEEMR